VKSTYLLIFKGPKKSDFDMGTSLYLDEKNLLHVRYKTNQGRSWEMLYQEYHYIRHNNKQILLYM